MRALLAGLAAVLVLAAAPALAGGYHEGVYYESACEGAYRASVAEKSKAKAEVKAEGKTQEKAGAGKKLLANVPSK